MMQAVKFNRVWAMPNSRTFTIKPIRQFVERDVYRAHDRGGVVVDPFANQCTYGDVTNDLNTEFDTTEHMDALAFLRKQESESADLILYDPPYSISQAAEMYRSYGKDKLEVSVANMRYWANCKDECARILKQGGVILCFGWNTNGLGINRGFTMTDILDVVHGGSKNDTLCTREVKQ